jgi:indole-3-glycerol phosphate synthase
MQFSQVAIAACVAVLASPTQAFAPCWLPVSSSTALLQRDASASSTSLSAVGAFVKKAKEASLRQYIADGIEDSVMEQYNKIKSALEADTIDLTNQSVGPLQETLTRRKGTITVIAEYKRKLANSGYIDEVFAPDILSRDFREFGAHGIAVMADERMGGCTYADMQTFVEDQRRSRNDVPGPVAVINNDLIIDELQIARTAAYGVSAVVLSLDLLGKDETTKMLKAAKAVDLEAIVSVSSKEEAQQAIDIGARMISVVNVPGVEDKTKIISDLTIPEGQAVATIANIQHQTNKGLMEVEEAWACRDKGFNCAWISDALYKSGNSEVEHPGAIIKSMASKSSVRWASPVAKSGRGEGAREYLGDILM